MVASSRPRESHPLPLTEPDVILPHHPALVIQPIEASLFLKNSSYRQQTLSKWLISGFNGMTVPSLQVHYSPSSLLPGRPPCAMHWHSYSCRSLRGYRPECKKFFPVLACDRVRSCVRPVFAAFSRAAGWYGDRRTGPKSPGGA